MRRAAMYAIIMACIMTAVCVPAQMQDVPARSVTINQGLVNNLGMVSGITADIYALINHKKISAGQQQLVMTILGQTGAVMQQMAAIKEIEGWQQLKQHRQLLDLKKQLAELKKQIEGNQH